MQGKGPTTFGLLSALDKLQLAGNLFFKKGRDVMYVGQPIKHGVLSLIRALVDQVTFARKESDQFKDRIRV